MKSFQKQLDDLRANGSERILKPISGRRGCFVNYKGREVLNLTSNDYLGFGGNHELLHLFYQGLDDTNIIDRYGLGVASSRLLTGDNELSHQLEDTLAHYYGRDVLLFNSGYHANIGILPSLFGKKDLILSDKLNHASIHDGIKLSQAKCKRFNHGDYKQLRSILENERNDYERVVVVTESVFSMDGDIVDLAELVKLKKEFDTMLYVDEAHAIGLYGDMGLGLAEEFGAINEIDLLVGTFGKAMASVGAFVVCSSVVKNCLINTSRSLIFTTALPPVVLHWNLFIFKYQTKMQAARDNLQSLSKKFRQELIKHELDTRGDSNIVPVIIGNKLKAIELAETMFDKNCLIFPVRPPAVPEGTSRFRISLTADMEWSDIKSIPSFIASKMG